MLLFEIFSELDFFTPRVNWILNNESFFLFIPTNSKSMVITSENNLDFLTVLQWNSAFELIKFLRFPHDTECFIPQLKFPHFKFENFEYFILQNFGPTFLL